MRVSNNLILLLEHSRLGALTERSLCTARRGQRLHGHLRAPGAGRTMGPNRSAISPAKPRSPTSCVSTMKGRDDHTMPAPGPLPSLSTRLIDERC